MPPRKLEASARSPQMIIAASGCGPPRHRWWSAVPAQGHPAVRSSVPTRSKKCPGIFDQGKGGSQHARTRSGVRLRLATITAGGCHVGQHPATSSVRIELIWEQEAARAAAQRSAQVEAVRARRAFERAVAADQKERARLYIESRIAEVAALNDRLAADIAELDGLFRSTLNVDDFLDFESLKEPAPRPRFAPAPVFQTCRPRPAGIRPL